MAVAVDDVEHVPRGVDCRIVRRGLLVVLVIGYSSSSSSLLLSGERCWSVAGLKGCGGWLMKMMWKSGECDKKMAPTERSKYIHILWTSSLRTIQAGEERESDDNEEVIITHLLRQLVLPN